MWKTELEMKQALTFTHWCLFCLRGWVRGKGQRTSCGFFVGFCLFCFCLIWRQKRNEVKSGHGCRYLGSCWTLSCLFHCVCKAGLRTHLPFSHSCALTLSQAEPEGQVHLAKSPNPPDSLEGQTSQNHELGTSSLFSS